MNKRQLLSNLTRIGMAEKEAKLYIAMLEKPEITAGDLHRISGVPRSKTYDTLDKILKDIGDDSGVEVVQAESDSEIDKLKEEIEAAPIVKLVDGVIEARGEKRGYDSSHRGGAGGGDRKVKNPLARSALIRSYSVIPAGC